MQYTVAFHHKKTDEPLRLEVQADNVRDAVNAALGILDIASCTDEYCLDFCVKNEVLQQYSFIGKRVVNAK